MPNLLAPIEKLRDNIRLKEQAAADCMRNGYIAASNLQKAVSEEPLEKFVHHVLATGRMASEVSRNIHPIKHITNDKRIYNEIVNHISRYHLTGTVHLVEDLECRPTIFIQLDNYSNFEGFAIGHPTVVAVYSFT